jgi:hypothetical protein
MMAPHFVTQAFQRAELKLFDRSLTSSELLRNLPHALFVDEAAYNHQALVGRKTVHELTQDGPALGFGLHADLSLRFPQTIDRITAVARRAMPAVRQRVGGDPQQPCCERRTTPLKPSQVPQSFMKDFRGHVFSFIAVVDPPHDKRVHAMKVLFIKLCETAWVLLGRLYQEPLMGEIANDAQRVPPG